MGVFFKLKETEKALNDLMLQYISAKLELKQLKAEVRKMRNQQVSNFNKLERYLFDGK